MRRNIKFILTLVKMKIIGSSVFRLSFFGAFFVDGSMFTLQVLMFEAIYSQIGSIGDWARGDMMIFIGTFSLLNAINMTVYFFGLIGIPRKVIDGDLDYYITKPVNPLLRLTFENVDLGSLPLIFLSVGIVIYGVNIAGYILSALDIALYTVLVLLMALLYYDMEVLLRTVAFFALSVGNLESIEGSLFDLCMKLPGTLFKGAYKVIFMFILPYGIMATLPSQALTGALTAEAAVYGVAIVAVFTFAALRFWKFGLSRYKSASS